MLSYSKLNSPSWWLPPCWIPTQVLLSGATQDKHNSFPHKALQTFEGSTPALLPFPNHDSLTARPDFIHPTRFHLPADRWLKVVLIFHKIMTFVTRGCYLVFAWRVGPTKVHLPCGLEAPYSEQSFNSSGQLNVEQSWSRGWGPPGANSFLLPLVSSLPNALVSSPPPPPFFPISPFNPQGKTIQEWAKFHPISLNP